ncbi:hypothetical protein Tco_1279136 [Tanacetum coccineum]
MLEQILTGNPQQEVVNFLAVQKADYCGYFYYRGRICCCCKLLWASFVDSKSNVRLWFNFLNTKIYIDNESIICIVKNHVYHSKTKHIAIRHHFIRDAYEKKLIHVLKIHIDDNVADLLTKAFDVSRTPDTYIVHSLVDKVNTASAHLVQLGKVCTALERLKKNTAKGTKCKLKRFP